MNEESSEPVFDQQPIHVVTTKRKFPWLLVGECLLAVMVLFLYLYRDSVFKKDEHRLPTKEKMKDVQVATGHYRTEYNRIPFPSTIPERDMEVRTQGTWIAALMAEYDALNPRQIELLSLPSALEKRDGIYQDNNGEWVLTDPWGEMYYAIFDADYDGSIFNPETMKTEPESRSVILYSAGPDRDPKTWKDNICSWR